MDIEVAPVLVDWTLLQELIRSAFASMEGRIDPPSSIISMAPADFARKAADETLIVAKSGGVLVGCIFCQRSDPWLYVGKMAVAPDQQGQGVGRLLMEEARCLAAELELLGVELETRIELTENHITFARLGFVKIAESSHEGYSRATSIWMRSVFNP